MTSGDMLGLLPVIGTMVIDSMPPATTTSSKPALTDPAARAMA